MLAAKDIIEKLGLQPHPREGGWFVETYRANETIPKDGLPPQYHTSRRLSTAIYYLLTPDTFSAMHRLQSTEVFHFYLGDPVTMLWLMPDKTHRTITLGQDLLASQQVQAVVPVGIWQGAFLNPGGRFALLGTTVAPGFEYADYADGERNTLIAGWPQARELITRLTR